MAHSDSSPSGHRTSRHHRCTDDFLDLLEDDFPQIPRYALRNAFYGVPPAPKREAIALCEWAVRTDNPAQALLSWACKNHRGTFRPAAAGDGEE